MCTVLLRLDPAARWPLLLGAVRDEFVDRSWDPPGRHWTGPLSGAVGGRDRTAGGTWLAVDPAARIVGAVLNGRHRVPDGADPAPAGPVSRTSRGGLPLAALLGRVPEDPAELAGYDGFHLLRATPEGARVWSWDGALSVRDLAPGDHILVNQGVDAADDPLVPHFLPRLRAAGTPDPVPGLPPGAAWDGWLDLMAADGYRPEDPRALLVRARVGHRTFASTSASLLAVAPDAVRFDFTADPRRPGSWAEVGLAG